jgi:phosphomannomutase
MSPPATFLRSRPAALSEAAVIVSLFPDGKPPQIPPLPPVEKSALSFRGRVPAALAFGTSGLRGLVTDITDLEAYINTRGFLEYLRSSGAANNGDLISVACDLRPSSDSPERSILRAVARAISDTGFEVDVVGKLPTPALTYHALQQRRPSIMVTGSHIPFDRNGIKFNKSTGEVLKSDEPGILRAVQKVRQEEYTRPESGSLFAANGMFKPDAECFLPLGQSEARQEYLDRYLNFFPPNALSGQRIVFYQHSGVGRDLMVELLTRLGAEVIACGRSETFVPIDTEAIAQDKLDLLQSLADQARRQHGPIDAVISTDGDSDRPLVAGVDAAGKVRFFGGDLLGIVVAEFLNADVAIVPISANDAVDRWAAAKGVTVIKTKIGSPFVIEAMQAAQAGGAQRVVGWEANGGFLTGTNIKRADRALASLPTRDAALPILAALCAAKERGGSLVERFTQLPRRFSKAGLIDEFPVTQSQALLQHFKPEDPRIEQVNFTGTIPQIVFAGGQMETAGRDLARKLEIVRHELERFFRPADGFDLVVRLNLLDGLRIYFRNGDIAHLRPSGNAPQLRAYAVANTQARADAIVAQAIREPDGLLRQIATALANPEAARYVEAIRRNIALTQRLFACSETPELIGTVSGSPAAQEFWQNLLNDMRESFRARAALSFQEDLPTNQAFGLLLLWQRLKPHWRERGGALVAFVFGDGTRSTPFTETDNAQKPAMATFVSAPANGRPRFLSMVELALHYFVPVQQYLRRSGFDGLVVKWGDEVQIPTRDLADADLLFRDADVVRFVSMREMNDDEARNKDWVGVNDEGHVTAFIPRRPLAQMEKLAGAGQLQRRDGKLFGGVNLGSIAVSRAFLDCLLAEFTGEVNDATANRKDRPALDPEFFTALTVATIADPAAQTEAWERARRESPEAEALHQRFPDILFRLRRAVRALENREHRKLKLVAMDFGDQYWGDIGQHAKIYEFYMALNAAGPTGDVARAIAGIPGARDARGNILINSTVSSTVQVRDSVLINAHLFGSGTVERSVLIGTRVGDIEAREAFDVQSTATSLTIEPRGGAYKVVAKTPVVVGANERVTTLFLPTQGAQLFRVLEATDLKDKAKNYAVTILGNPMSFQQAHAEMGALGVETLRQKRSEAEAAVLATDLARRTVGRHAT